MSKVENKYSYPSLVKIYKISMISLSLAIVFISIWDLAFSINESTITIIARLDWIIWSVFILDLIINLIIVEDKKRHIKISLIEIAVVTPFAVFLKLPVYLRSSKLIQKTGVLANPVVVTPGKTSQEVINKINLLLSQKFIIRSFAFIMKPNVIRISKFINLSGSYFRKTKNSKTDEDKNNS